MLTSFFAVLPQITLAIGAIAVLMLHLFFGRCFKHIAYVVAQLTLALGAWAIFWQHEMGIASGFGGMTMVNGVTYMLQVFTLLIGVFVFVYARDYITHYQMQSGEFYALALLSMLGAFVLIGGHNLLVIYVGLELLSLPMYAMIAMKKADGNGAEAAIKYFLMGAVGSGLLLYGISFIYGITGQLDLTGIHQYLMTHQASDMSLVIVAMVLMIVTMLFKLGVAPFHMWVPDVYEGAPTPITTFVSTIPKVAVFGMLIHILSIGLMSQQTTWHEILMVVAIVSIFLGNIVALAQTNVRRILGFSTVGHIGFVLLALTLTPLDIGVMKALFYLMVYVLSAAAAFGVLTIAETKGYQLNVIEDFNGLGDRNRWLSIIMLIILFSMAGIPPLAGFMAKAFVILGLIGQQHYIIACYALLLSVVGAFYYLRIVKAMYFKKPTDTMLAQQDEVQGHMLGDGSFVLTFNSMLLVLLGVLPGILIVMTQYALFSG